MTSILARYLVRTIVGHTILVMLVLLALSGLYLFISQQDDIGQGTFGVDDAFMFALLNLPQYAFDLLPIASLIGALLALGNLARSLELIVVRAAGVSTLRIGMWVGTAGLLLMLMTAVIGEFIAPPVIFRTSYIVLTYWSGLLCSCSSTSRVNGRMWSLAICSTAWARFRNIS